jgi:hypothetical protein
VERKTGVPGFMSLKTQAASHFQEETVTRISRTVRFIPQVLRDTLRFARSTATHTIEEIAQEIAELLNSRA